MFHPISQEILGFFTWSKKFTPTNIPTEIQWLAGIGQLRVWFGQILVSHWLKAFDSIIQEIYEFFDMEQIIDPCYLLIPNTVVS